jgi:hypothetical protein
MTLHNKNRENVNSSVNAETNMAFNWDSANTVRNGFGLMSSINKFIEIIVQIANKNTS